ncbi:MAG TPA: glycosyltransferase N-terminal domain-containing protein [Candidatus Hydrogenedens sp.]|nr:glycosyltransferase N-terminal domain-containing protein [Candidatus Hydrogenedens sp.]
MWLFLYNCFWRILTPLAKIYLQFSKKYFPLKARFQPPIPDIKNPLWIHACSVGEVNQISPIIEQWVKQFPEIPLLLTVNTISGYQQAEKKYKGMPIAITWCPFDHPKSVEHFLKQIFPRILVLVETELWPNLILKTHKFHIPIAIINGRISDRFLRTYQRWKKIYQKLLSCFSFILVQTEEYANRFIELGSDADKVYVVGNIKYDAVTTEVDFRIRGRLRISLGIPSDGKVIVLGSLRDGDEKVAKKIWDELKDKYSNLWLILAPRHPDKKDIILNQLGSNNILLRSENLNGKKNQGERIIVVDTLGELIQFYSIATVAIIGGSWFPGVDGHNPLEPAGLGVVPIFGPYMRNFQEPADTLLKDNGAIQLNDYNELPSLLERLLSSSYEPINYGTRARKIVLQNRGAVSKTIHYLAKSIMK